ncbi:Ubiquitin-conjugating enzyme E2 D4-like isoform X1 [Oopsacas minuta]|uniref:E2 ubiquitin-conjugating enzyme n=1 Tax=Oopsacas minuta TaxID=111878 RepID=A0AAV7JLH4_9METZ|nr:Ubiquitin-conjugating enzyme E2 D4-like isoform X1 [Oopsacas minuta]
MSLSRLKKELKEIKENPVEPVTAEPRGDEDLYNWVGTIKGPKDTPYEGGVFYLDIKFCLFYPFRPPKVRFITPIYHPHINSSGQLSIQFLESDWSPAYTIIKVLIHIWSLLPNPNPDDPLVPEIAHLYKEDIQLYNKNAKEMTQKHAM